MNLGKWRLMFCYAFLGLLIACSNPNSQGGKNFLEAQDQNSDGKSLMVDKVGVGTRGWLAILKTGGTKKEDIYLIRSLAGGKQTSVKMRLTNKIKETGSVDLILYVDSDGDRKLDANKDTIAQKVTITVTISAAPSKNENFLVVSEQRGDGTSVNIEQLNLLKPGWLYLTKLNVKTPNDIYATIKLSKGSQRDYKVSLDNSISETGPIAIGLHIDDGDGTFDPDKDKIAKGSRNKNLQVTVEYTVGGATSNALVIEDQVLIQGEAKSIQVKTLDILAPALLFIAKDNNGKPGKIIARIVKSTSSSNFSISLKEELTENQSLHATLYDGTSWNLKTPILKDKNGTEIKFKFDVTIQAATQGAVLEIEDQVLTKDFDTLLVKKTSVPKTFLKVGKIFIYQFKNGKAKDKVAEIKLSTRKTYTDIKVNVGHLITGTEYFQAKMLDEKGKSFSDAGGKIIQMVFSVRGDSTEAKLFAESQQAPSDLRTMQIKQFVIPPRFKDGAYLAIFSDNKGKRGKVLGKKHFPKGVYEDKSLTLTRKLIQKQLLHVALFAGRSWRSSNPAITSLSGQELLITFVVDHTSFHPVLEVADQTLSDNTSLAIKKVLIPFHITSGGYLGIFSDKNGKADVFLGKRRYPRGNHANKVIKLVKQEGKKTLHAVLYEGIKWDPTNAAVIKDISGKDMHFTFRIGAKSLNYLTVKDQIAVNSRRIKIERAHSHKEMVWIVVARDHNGKPGTILAKTRIGSRSTRSTVLWDLYNHFEKKGTHKEYIKGVGGAYRRYIHGEENLHVTLYADNPKDHKFTYSPGGTEDKPLLDAEGKIVTKRMKVTVDGSMVSTPKNVKSNRYYKLCHFLPHWRKIKTPLSVDCRCYPFRFPRCSVKIAVLHGSVPIGKGPRFKDFGIFAHLFSGFGEKSTNEIIAVVRWKDHKTKHAGYPGRVDTGAVMAIHADTGARRIIGGRAKSLTKGFFNTGKGPILSRPFRILKGPNGMYYIPGTSNIDGMRGVTSTSGSPMRSFDIIRMDPKTGDREFVWRSHHLGRNLTNQKNPYGICHHGRSKQQNLESVHIYRRAFAMDPQGNFYLSYSNNSHRSNSEGVGIIKVSADGKKCSFVTRSDTGKDNIFSKGKNIGSGPIPQAGPYHGMLYKDGYLYAKTFIEKSFYKINVSTGDREILYKSVSAEPERIIKWDPHRKLIWLQGRSFFTTFYDPVTKKRTRLFCRDWKRTYKGMKCLHRSAWYNTGWPDNGGFWFHPTKKDYVIMNGLNSMTKVHLPTGTDVILSW